MSRRTKSDWDNIIESWKQSGFSHKEYCQKSDLNYWTFRDQRIKREKDPLKSSKNKLVRILASIQAPKILSVFFRSSVQQEEAKEANTPSAQIGVPVSKTNLRHRDKPKGQALRLTLLPIGGLKTKEIGYREFVQKGKRTTGKRFE